MRSYNVGSILVLCLTTVVCLSKPPSKSLKNYPTITSQSFFNKLKSTQVQNPHKGKIIRSNTQQINIDFKNFSDLLSNADTEFEDVFISDKRVEKAIKSASVSTTSFEKRVYNCSLRENEKKTTIACDKYINSDLEHTNSSSLNETELLKKIPKLLSSSSENYLRSCFQKQELNCQRCLEKKIVFLLIDTKNDTLKDFHRNFIRTLCRNYKRKLKIRRTEVKESELVLSFGQWLRVAAYIVIFVSGVVGNSLVVVTLIYHRNMRSITNIFLLNLVSLILFI